MLFFGKSKVEFTHIPFAFAPLVLGNLIIAPLPGSEGTICVCVCDVIKLYASEKDMMGFGKIIWCTVTAQHTLQ